MTILVTQLRYLKIPSYRDSLNQALPYYVVGASKRQEMRGEVHLQRLFSTFPGGWPGIGLLLLRGAIGLVVLFGAGFSVSGGPQSGIQIWMVVSAVAAGAALILGLFTPVAALLTGLGAIAAGFSLLPAPVSNVTESKLALILIATVAVAIACLGPGGFSVDARLFGRREIIIPRRPEQ